jgi:hypothetical protein
VLRLGDAEAGEACELASPLAAGIIGNADQGSVCEADTTCVEPVSHLLCTIEINSTSARKRRLYCD